MERLRSGDEFMLGTAVNSSETRKFSLTIWGLKEYSFGMCLVQCRMPKLLRRV